LVGRGKAGQQVRGGPSRHKRSSSEDPLGLHYYYYSHTLITLNRLILPEVMVELRFSIFMQVTELPAIE